MKTKLGCILGVVGTLSMLVPLYGQGADRGGVARPVGSEAASLVTGPSGRLRSAIAGVPPTMRIRLTPVPSQGPGSYPPGSFITGQTLHATPGAFRAFFNVQLEDWDPLGNGPLLHVWQVRVDGTGYLGENAVPPQSGCNIVPPVQTCPSANAAGHAACAAAFGETGTLCTNVPPLRCNWGFANRTRADWVLLAEEPNVLADANLVTTSALMFGVTTAPDSGSTDGGLLYYGATLVADIPACALGQYTIPFGVAETFAGDEQAPTNLIPILELIAAVVEIAPLPPECETNDDCDDLDPCTTDTCDLQTGTCEHTPIPNCLAPPSTPINYQGQLVKDNVPVTGMCDFRFDLWDDSDLGNLIGNSPLNADDVPVSNGLFTVALDFGAGAFNGDPRWLEIEVQCPADPDFVLLSPRVELTPAPYALRALEGVGGPNALHVTPDGNVGIGTATPSYPLEMGSGAHCTAGGVWTDASDRKAKENFIPLDRGLVLEQLADLEVARWNYKVESPSVQHIGPVAQDFHALFGLGADDKHLAALDTAGVALAAIQGLYEIVQEKDCLIDELGSEISNLQSEISELKEIVNALSKQNGGGR